MLSLAYPVHTLSPVSVPSGKEGSGESLQKSTEAGQRIFGIVLFICGCRRTVIGLERIPDDQPILFVGNHRSFFDILCCHNAINRPLGFMSKDGILKVPILPWYMKDIGCTFLDRSDLKRS